MTPHLSPREEAQLRFLLHLHASTPIPPTVELIRHLRAALVNMRKLARKRHWAYDFNTEMALISCLRREKFRLHAQNMARYAQRLAQEFHTGTGPYALNGQTCAWPTGLLAQGYDPATGRKLPPDHPFHNRAPA